MSVHSACECVGRRQESHFNIIFKLLMAVHLQASVNGKWVDHSAFVPDATIECS